MMRLAISCCEKCTLGELIEGVTVCKLMFPSPVLELHIRTSTLLGNRGRMIRQVRALNYSLAASSEAVVLESWR